MNKQKFYSLTHEILNDNEINEVYIDALDAAFSNKNIKNIAITGIYGAGKSSIWQTYIHREEVKNGKPKNVITILLGDYSKNFENYSEENENRIEKQIINQIAAQIDGSKIPLTNYRYKENLTKKSLFASIITSLSFILSIIFWSNRPLIVDFINLVLNINNSLIVMIVATVACLIMFGVPLCSFFYYIFKKNRFEISKIAIKGTEVNNEKTRCNDETILDRDIKEIVYMIRCSGSSVIVFEDLDRYNNSKIFCKLRELNYLVNANIRSEIPIRFIYMLHDSLFQSKDRTKFFDFILPIIPIIDSNNSEVKLNELISNLEYKPSQNLVRAISYYIDDMRLLKNIINEYCIYSAPGNIQIKELGLKEDKLFAMIIFKNIFPHEFNLLYEGKSCINKIFELINCERETRKQSIANKISKIKDDISFLKDQLGQNIFEIMAFKIPSNISVSQSSNDIWARVLEVWSKTPNSKKTVYVHEGNSYRSSSFQYDYNEFTTKFIVNATKENTEYFKRITDSKVGRLNTLFNEVINLENEEREIIFCTISDVLRKIDSSELNRLFTKISTSEKENQYNLSDDKYFFLIKYFIMNGLIDETYWNYIGYFHKGVLGINDKMFLTKILVREAVNPYLELENPDEIIERLDFDNLETESILNKSLLKYCLKEKKNNEIKKISDVAFKNSNIDIIGILASFTAEDLAYYVRVIFEYNDKILKYIIDNNVMNNDLVNSILLYLYGLKNCDINKLKTFNIYIEPCSYLLLALEKIDSRSFFKNIEACGTKFLKLENSKISVEVIKNIESIKAYVLNISNICFIVEKLNKQYQYDNLISIINNSRELVAIKEYINSHFAQFITDYITYANQLANNEEEVYDILNSEITFDKKIEYLEKNIIELSSLEKIKNIQEKEMLRVCDVLFNKRRIAFITENLQFYWSLYEPKSDVQISDFFIDYVNKNISSIKELKYENANIWLDLINCNNLSEDVVDLVFDAIEGHIISISLELGKERIAKIYKLLEINTHNIKVLMNNQLYSEICYLFEESEDINIDNVFLDDSELFSMINSNFLQILFNSKIPVNQIISLLEELDAEIFIEDYKNLNDALYEFILCEKLCKENIVYILESFNTFKNKDLFAGELERQNLLTEYRDLFLPKGFIEYILRSIDIEDDFKQKVIIHKILLKEELSDLTKWLSMLDNAKPLIHVLQGKHPKYDYYNTNDDIYTAMENIELISKKNNRLYLRKSKWSEVK